MSNTLTLSAGNSGFNFAGFIWLIEQGLFSTNSMGTDVALYSTSAAGTELFSTSSMGTEFRVDLTQSGGDTYATGFTVYDEGQVIAQASFATPQLLGAGLDLDLTGMLFADTQLDFRGGKGVDWANGFDLADRFRLGDGNDMAAGGAGNDQMSGGKGNDLLAGGADDDILRGDAGHDLLIGGPGNDVLKGGRGNDVVVLDQDGESATGGQGNDTFIFDTDGPLRADVKDFDRDDDLLLFTGVSTTASGTPEGFTGETLADLENGMIDDFVWREGKQGVQIQAGDAEVLLRGVKASDVLLDTLLFTTNSVNATVSAFDLGTGGGVLGTNLAGDDLEGTTYSDYLTITMNNLFEFETYGGDIAGFITYGEGEGL